ncbi:6546_t:CDS:2 [Dentiscutata erythropus]|uniref:6546_t:CDS:1 n=1 Tax=Dentiscutata erythropus TaxID=1348616 RepID=A0A9N9CNR4_9GLOM|nr:6546_t:CDS:2 [Dentiscutata erythropus]
MTDSAWKEFNKYPPNTPKGHPVAECIHCDQKLSGQAQRLRSHLNSCQKYQNFLNLNQNEPTISNSLPVTVIQKNPNLPVDPYLSRQLNPIEQKTIDKKIARAFYACGIPHVLIENNFFIAALKSLHPTYNPPSHWLLGNNLLSDEYKEIKDHVQKIYSKEKFISISTDGWSNQRNELIINYMSLTTHGPIFIKSTVTKTNSHIAEYIAEGIQNVILEFLEVKETFVVSVVTDNAANMPHSANLIISDIFKKSNLIDDELQWTRNTLEIAKKNKTIALVNPIKTRWETQLAVLEKLLESKSSIQNSARSSNRILIADEDNWDNISVLAEVLRPIVKCITMFESNSATLSLVYKEMADMKNLEYNITNPIQDSVIDIITKRFNYMQSPIMLLAYLLDGRFYPHHHFRPTVHALTQLFQDVTPYISNFILKPEKEIHAKLYKEYGELVALLDSNIILQEAAKDLHPHELVWLSDIEQEVDDENDFWEGFDELTDQVLYDIE